MKKTVRKMSLSRETLGKLDPTHLKQVKGQGYTDGCVLSINICSNHETCSTCVPETQVDNIA
ncbi:MAG: class I lanthipeptide [Thermoanaerobaculia bacterium]